MRFRAIAAALFFVLLCQSVAVAATNRWLHVRVDEGLKGEQVKINLPLALVESMLPLVKEEHLAMGRVHLEQRGVSVSDLRPMWDILKAQGDVMLAEVQSSSSDVRVFIEGDYFHVESTEASENTVNVNVPVPVVDALLSGEGDEINLAAAIRVLGQMGAQEIVSVQDEDTTVRVWIDESNQPGH